MYEHAVKSLTDRLQPGSQHYAVVKRGLDRIFDLMPRASHARNSILDDRTISDFERKRRLDDFASGTFLQQIDDAVCSVKPIAATIETARRDRPDRYVSADEQTALDNVSILEGVAYFARRVLDGK